MRAKERGNNKGAIKGLVIPEQWDKEGRVLAITIQTSQEEIYFVEQTDTGQEMLKFLHQEVEVKGKITERLNGNSMITVKGFRVTKPDYILQQPITV